MKKTIKKVYKIAAPAKKVWDALVSQKIIEVWGGGPAKMDDKVGTEFSLWGGDIHGKNIEVVRERKLVQEWFGGDWPKPSIVTFTIKPEKDKTVLELEHTGVPDGEVDDIDAGWDDYYVGPMKDLLEKK
jgi:activator of HSP90 ATPase